MNKDMKTAIVVGATGEIGGAIASLLVEKDFHVICFGRDKTKLSSLKKDLGENVSTFSVDLRDTENLEMMISDIKLEFGEISLIVMAAGTFKWDDEFSDGEDEAIEFLSEVNFASKKRFYEIFRKISPSSKTVWKSIGSHITDENKFSEEDVKRFQEVGYAKSMKLLKKWVSETRNSGKEEHFLLSEPGLVDTSMARGSFTEKRLGYKVDWDKDAQKPADYAKIFWGEDLEEIFQ